MPAEPIATALLPTVLVCARQAAASARAVRAGLAAAWCVACAAFGGAASVMPWMTLSLLPSSMSW